jgi:hypothetical protein
MKDTAEIEEEDPHAPKMSAGERRQHQLELIEISAPDELDLSAAVQRKRDRKNK